MTNVRATPQQFEEVVREILEFNGFQITDPANSGKDKRYDWSGRFLNRSWLVEAKHYLSPVAEPSLLLNAASFLAVACSRLKVPKGLLVVASYVEPSVQTAIQTACGIIVVDRRDLYALTAPDIGLRTRLASALQPALRDLAQGPEATTLTAIAQLYQDVEVPLSDPTPARQNESDQQAENLASELAGIQPGRQAWSSYENVCTKILRFLFEPDLSRWVPQNRTEDGLQRFDLVCKVTSNNDFWRFLVDQLNSRYVLFEFKNYSEAISQNQVISTERYLFEMALRKVAFIVTRVPPDDGAVQVCRGAMREHGKLIIALTDDDLTTMLKMKQSGSDPTDHLSQLVDTFLLTLSR